MHVKDIARGALAAAGAALALAAASVPVVANATAGTSAGSNYSMYPTASAAAVYVDNMIAARKAGEVKVDTVGEAAGAAGFADLDVLDTTVSTWDTYIQSATSRNTVSYSYDSYEQWLASGGDKNVANLLVEYGRFGQLLQNLGLTGTTDSGIVTLDRHTLGPILEVTWFVCNGADSVVKWCFEALNALNPFRYLQFTGVGSNDRTLESVGDIDANNMKAANESYLDPSANEGGYNAANGGSIAEAIGNYLGSSSALKSVLTTFTQIYNFCYRNAWLVVIPVLVAMIAVIGLVRGSWRSVGGLGKRVGLVLLVVLVGVPLWGAAYTAVLSRMSSIVNSTSATGYGSPANRVILSTLVDTAGWAREGFVVTDDMTIESETEPVVLSDSRGTATVPTGTPTDDARANVRNTVLAINEVAAYGRNLNDTIYDKMSDTNDEGGGHGGFYDSVGAKLSDSDEDYDGAAITERAQELITSYMSGDTYEAAAYESYVKGGEKNSQAMAEWLQATSNPEAYAEGLSKLRGNDSEEGVTINDAGLLQGNAPERANSVADNTELSDLYDQLANLDPDGANAEEVRDKIMDILQREQNTSNNDGEAIEDGENALASIKWFGMTAEGGGASLNVATIPAGDLIFNTSTGAYSGSLSAIGTYNFLNTRFDSTGWTVYSAAKSANTQSRVSHYATSLAGGGVVGPLYAINGIALMLAFAITAIVYGISMLFSNLARSVKLLVSIPGASLGLMGSIARAVVVAVMMIFELIATALCYVIVRDLLYVVNEILTSGMLGTIADLTAGWGSLGGMLLVPLMLLISTILLIIYIIMAIKLRGTLTGIANESLANLTMRLTGNKQNLDAQSHAVGRLAQGALIGGAVMGGTGAGTAALGLGGGALLGGLASAGRESVNGDMIDDSQASEANTDNSSRDSSQATHEGATSNSLDKRAGDSSLTASTGIEGGARAAGAGLLTGQLVGEESGGGADAGAYDSMRSASASELGSAAALATNEFGINANAGDAYSSASEIGSAYADNMSASDMRANNVSAASMSAEGAFAGDVNAGDAFAEGAGSSSSVTATQGDQTSFGASAAGDGSVQRAGYDFNASAAAYGADGAGFAYGGEGVDGAGDLAGSAGDATNFASGASGDGISEQAGAYGADVSAFATGAGYGYGYGDGAGYGEGAGAIAGTSGDGTNFAAGASGDGLYQQAGAYGYGQAGDGFGRSADASAFSSAEGASGAAGAGMPSGTVGVEGTADVDGSFGVYGSQAQFDAAMGAVGTSDMPLQASLGDQSSQYDIHGDSYVPSDGANEFSAYSDAELGDVTADGATVENVDGQSAPANSVFEASGSVDSATSGSIYGGGSADMYRSESYQGAQGSGFAAAPGSDAGYGLSDERGVSGMTIAQGGDAHMSGGLESSTGTPYGGGTIEGGSRTSGVDEVERRAAARVMGSQGSGFESAQGGYGPVQGGGYSSVQGSGYGSVQGGGFESARGGYGAQGPLGGRGAAGGERTVGGFVSAGEPGRPGDPGSAFGYAPGASERMSGGRSAGFSGLERGRGAQSTSPFDAADIGEGASESQDADVYRGLPTYNERPKRA